MRIHFLLIAVLLLGGTAQGAEKKKSAASEHPPAPISTDFTKYEKKFPWAPSREFLDGLAAKRPDCNFYEEKIPPYTLPDMFALKGGGQAADTGAWENKRRAELLDLFRSEVYGVAPPRPADLAFKVLETNPKAMGGQATLKRIEISFTQKGEKFSFTLTLFVPNHRVGKAPAFLLLNHRGPENTDPTRKIQSAFWPAEYAIARGYAMAAINVADEVDPDKPKADTGVRMFYRKNAEHPEALTWGALSAWAWSGSRGLDYLATDPDINAAQVAVIGHSRGGKTSLWCGAQDTRFALVCVNCAGEGGPSISRHNIGETLGQVAKNFPHWFAPKYATYDGRVNELPLDMHELVALVAPRGYHGTDATSDMHADPRGSFLALVEASKVWSMFGKAETMKPEMPRVNDLMMNGAIAYHLREGGHGLEVFDWKNYMDHADWLFKRVTAGAYYFEGWAGRNVHAGEAAQPWAKDAPTHLTRRMLEEFPGREPAWGWRDDSQEVMNRQIDLAADHGLAFWAFCWYWHDNKKPINQQAIDEDSKHTGMNLFLKAPNNQRMRFCLMIANHAGFEIVGEERWREAAKSWVPILKHPQYLAVGGKPLVIIFHKVNEPAGMAAIQQVAREAGLPGVALAVCGPASPAEQGYTLRTHYNIIPGYSKGGEKRPYTDLVAAHQAQWSGSEQQPYIPVVTAGWDRRPWEGPAGMGQTPSWYFPDRTPAAFEDFLRRAVDWMNQHPKETAAERIVTIYAWNEFGEGGYIAPTRDDPQGGYLKAVRNVVTRP